MVETENVTRKNDISSNHRRRDFLKKALTLTVSSTVVYVVGAAFKDLDGSLVAGAKTCGYNQGIPAGGDCRTVGCDSVFIDTGSSCAGQAPSRTACCNAGYSTRCVCW